MNFGGPLEKCEACKKTVYVAERLAVDGHVFHNTCLRCEECGCKLKAGNYTALAGKYYCKPHFKKLFRLHGNYSQGFDLEKPQEQFEKKKAGGSDSASDLGASYASHARTTSDVSDSSIPSEAAHMRKTSIASQYSGQGEAEDLASIRAKLKSTRMTAPPLDNLPETNENGRAAAESVDSMAFNPSVDALKNRFVESDSPSRPAGASVISQGSETLKDAPKVDDLKQSFVQNENDGASRAAAASFASQGSESLRDAPKVSSLKSRFADSSPEASPSPGMKRTSIKDDSVLETPEGLAVEVDQLRSSKRMLEDKVDSQDAEIERLQAQVSTGAQERAEQAEASHKLESDLRSTRDRLSSLETELRGVTDDLASEKARRAKAEEALVQEQDRASGAESANEEISRLNASLKEERESRIRAEQERDNAIQGLRSAEAKYSDELRAAASENDAQLRDAKELYTQSKEQLAEKENELSRLMREVDELRQNLQDEVGKTAMLEVQVEQLQAESSSKSGSAEAERKLDQAESRNHALTTKLNEEKARNARLKEELDEAKARARSATSASDQGRPASASAAGSQPRHSAASLPSRDDDSHPLAQVRRLRQQVEQMRLQMPKGSTSRTPRSSTAQTARTVDGTRRHTSHFAPGDESKRLQFDDDGVSSRTRAKTRGY